MEAAKALARLYAASRTEVHTRHIDGASGGAALLAKFGSSRWHVKDAIFAY
jgi:hypothetical protein